MIYNTAIASLSAQFIIGVIDYLALKTDVNAKDEILKDLLKVELIVQVIEFLFYVWLLYYFNQVSHNITPFRYLDWSITTPLMLITLAAFLNHDGSKTERLSDFLYNNAGSMIKIVALNAAMLFFGFIGEIGYLNQYLSTALGFIPFAINFKDIKEFVDAAFSDMTLNQLLILILDKIKKLPYTPAQSANDPYGDYESYEGVNEKDLEHHFHRLLAQSAPHPPRRAGYPTLSRVSLR
jgi:hypothetical protein